MLLARACLASSGFVYIYTLDNYIHVGEKCLVCSSEHLIAFTAHCIVFPILALVSESGLRCTLRSYTSLARVMLET
jgi:hypothetical protein